MPIENNPEIEDSSEEEQIEYKKKPVIKKPPVRNSLSKTQCKVNRDINEMKESIKKLENLAISKNKSLSKAQFETSAPPPPPPSAPASTSIPRKKQRRIRQIIYSESEDEDNSMNQIIQQVQKIEPDSLSQAQCVKVPEPRPPPMKPRRRFKFKN